MEFIRKVVNGVDLKDFIEIPNSLINKKVEILIFPIEEIKTKKKEKKSLSVFLSKHANTSLVEKKEDIWFKETKE